MIKIGNIIFDKTLLEDKKIKTLMENELLALVVYGEAYDKTLPTLFIGWSHVKPMFKNQSILEKKIDEKKFWTFSVGENIQNFHEDIDKFTEKLYQDMEKSIDYQCIDPFVLNIENLEDLNDYIPDGVISYLNENLIYSNLGNTIFGLDLNVFEFKNFEKEAVKDFIKTISCRVLEEKYEEGEGVYYYKKYFNAEIDIKYIPYFMSKEAVFIK